MRLSISRTGFESLSGCMKIKSSKCGSSTCVEVDFEETPGTVIVYDEWGNKCYYDYDEWKAFVAGVKLGEFDLPK
jgi:hypothetical protein